MATRHVDVEGTSDRIPKSGAAAPKKLRENQVTSGSLQPVSEAPGASSDPSPTADAQSGGTSGSREQRIADAAYRRAKQRGFIPGQELDDWLAAEREIDGGNTRD